MAPQLPSLGGRTGGFPHATSAPLVAPKHRLTYPDFKKWHCDAQVSARIDALGGLKLQRSSGKVGTSSTPDLRSWSAGLKLSEAMNVERARLATGPDALFAQSGHALARPTSPPIATDGAWQTSTNMQASEGMSFQTSGRGFHRHCKGQQRGRAGPTAGSDWRWIYDQVSVGWTGGSCLGSRHRGGKSQRIPRLAPVPSERIPVVAHWNFRAMPLEAFDLPEDFETHTPEEWMELVKKTPTTPQANVVPCTNISYMGMPCWVHDYDAKSNRYRVELEDGSQREVKRLSLRFNAEDASEFGRRLDTCRSRKAACELQESFIAYIDHQADSSITLMSTKAKEKFTSGGVKQALQAAVVDPELPAALLPVIRGLLLEAEQAYVQAAKFFLVKAELIHGLGTHTVWIEESSKFASLLCSFFPPPVPGLGQVSDYNCAEQSVPQVIATLCEVPTLSHSAVGVTLHVWQAYFDEICKHRILNTTRKDSSDDSRMLIRVLAEDDTDYSHRVFEVQEFETHMVNHREHVTTHLKRKWRDYLIAEVLDKLSDEHNFFIDNEEQHNKTPLHRILRKFDIMLSTQMRWLVEQSIKDWRSFLGSFTPSPDRCLPSPLLNIHLVPLNGKVVMKPDPEELVDVLMKLLDGVTETTDAISVIELEMIPFCSLARGLCYNPRSDLDGQGRSYELLEDAKRDTVEVIMECFKEPQVVKDQFQQYAYLLAEQSELLDPSDVEGTRDKVAGYLKAAREVEVLTASVLRFPLFQLQCAGIIESLSSCAHGLAEHCLRDVADSFCQGAAGILRGWEATHDRILSIPQNEVELASLKEFMATVDETVKKPLEARTARALEQLQMVEGFFYEVDSNAIENAFAAFAWPAQIQLDIMQSEHQLDKEKIQFIERLDREKEEFWMDMAVWKETLVWCKSLDDYSTALSVESKIEKLNSDLLLATERVQSYHDREKLFQIERSDYHELEEVIEEFKPFYRLWCAVCDFKHCEDEWIAGPLAHLVANDIENFIDKQWKDSNQMYVAFEGQVEPQKVVDAFRKEIQAFKEYIPVISRLCQQAIEPQHLAQLCEEMECEVKEDQYTLQWLLDQGVLNHIEAVVTISAEAQEQYSSKLQIRAHP